MPTLLDVQRAMCAALIDRDDGAFIEMLADGVPEDRLDIYRNTFVAAATRALRLSFPAVHRLVGGDFFAGAAAAFIAQEPPREACLDHYGAAFPDFLHGFPPAAALGYLADVARLEWAVSRALHAPDAAPLDLMRLHALQPGDQNRVCFAPHPSVALLRLDHPADAVWRGVLGGDDAALAAVDPASGPVHLLVERGAAGVEVSRLTAAAWRFAAALCAGRPLADILAEFSEADGEAEQSVEADGGGTPPLQEAPAGPWSGGVPPPSAVRLADHLAAGRFVDFRLADFHPGHRDATAPASSSPEFPT
jgi:hypothetical protein